MGAMRSSDAVQTEGWAAAGGEVRAAAAQPLERTSSCRPARPLNCTRRYQLQVGIVAYVPRGHVEGARAPPGPDGRTQKQRMLAGEQGVPVGLGYCCRCSLVGWWG